MTEHIEAAVLMRWVEGARRERPELALLHAIPNGGKRPGRTARAMRAEGQRRGVPDYCLPVARGGFHGLYLELKTATGRTSPEQRWWLAELAAQGFATHVARGWEQARDLITDYLAADAPLAVLQTEEDR